MSRQVDPPPPSELGAKLLDALDQFLLLSDEGLFPQEHWAAKIEVMERLLERMRHEIRHTGSSVDLDHVMAGKTVVEDGHVFFFPPAGAPEHPSGKKPVLLQPHLLAYLLLNHNPRRQVFVTIQGFVEKNTAEFGWPDYKRTQTGVMRCFTNTRDAARQLREYGLVAFLHGRYKQAWVLTIEGIAAAMVLLDRGIGPHTDKPVWQENPLHDSIREALRPGEDLETLIDTVFGTRPESFSERDYTALQKRIRRVRTRFRRTALFQSGGSWIKERTLREQYLEAMRRLPRMDDFLVERVMEIQIDQVIQKAGGR